MLRSSWCARPLSLFLLQPTAAPTPRLDILICNAGTVFAPLTMSADGYESAFATNHLGHWLLVSGGCCLQLPEVRGMLHTGLGAREAASSCRCDLPTLFPLYIRRSSCCGRFW